MTYAPKTFITNLDTSYPDNNLICTIQSPSRGKLKVLREIQTMSEVKQTNIKSHAKCGGGTLEPWVPRADYLALARILSHWGKRAATRWVH